MEFRLPRPQSMCSIMQAGRQKRGIANYRKYTTKIQSAISNSGVSTEGGLAWKLVGVEGQSHRGSVRASALLGACSQRILIRGSSSCFLTIISKSVGTIYALKNCRGQNLTWPTPD